MICVGIDWATQHHDVQLGPEGTEADESFRIADDPDGYDELVERIDELQKSAEDQVSVALESTEGLLVQRCLSEGYRVYLLNPKVVSE